MLFQSIRTAAFLRDKAGKKPPCPHERKDFYRVRSFCSAPPESSTQPCSESQAARAGESDSATPYSENILQRRLKSSGEMLPCRITRRRVLSSGMRYRVFSPS